MTSLNLNREEIELISRILNITLEDLRSEIHHTDRFEYKDILREKERIIQGLLIRLEKISLAEAEKVHAG